MRLPRSNGDTLRCPLVSRVIIKPLEVGRLGPGDQQFPQRRPIDASGRVRSFGDRAMDDGHGRQTLRIETDANRLFDGTAFRDADDEPSLKRLP